MIVREIAKNILDMGESCFTTKHCKSSDEEIYEFSRLSECYQNNHTGSNK